MNRHRFFRGNRSLSENAKTNMFVLMPMMTFLLSELISMKNEKTKQNKQTKTNKQTNKQKQNIFVLFSSLIVSVLSSSTCPTPKLICQQAEGGKKLF